MISIDRWTQVWYSLQVFCKIVTSPVYNNIGADIVQRFWVKCMDILCCCCCIAMLFEQYSTHIYLLAEHFSMFHSFIYFKFIFIYSIINYFTKRLLFIRWISIAMCQSSYNSEPVIQCNHQFNHQTFSQARMNFEKKIKRIKICGHSYLIRSRN